MIVPDGRTDYEKLLELLGVPEETHLDLKASLDLDIQVGKLKFIKDVLAMSNRPGGGYLLIGVDDAGHPCMPIGTITDRRRFDGAKLGGLIRSFIEGEIHLLVQIHEHHGDEIVLVYVPHHRDGLPVPLGQDGEYRDDQTGKMVAVFRAGELWVREGPENVRIRHAHWPDVLSEYARKIREETGEATQRLIRELLGARKSSPSGSPEVALHMEMDEATLSEAANVLLESGDDLRLRQFIRSLRRSVASAASLAEYEGLLNQWVVFCAQALYFERKDLFEQAVQKIFEGYEKLGLDADSTRKRLSVITRIYVLGSLAVRLESWAAVHALALRPVSADAFSSDYIYSSWIRHGQVDASRAGLTDDHRGVIISAARELMVEHPAMRPDSGGDAILPDAQIDSRDVFLNSLCEFDIAYCFIVFAEGTGRGSAYPSSVGFDEERGKPMAERIVSDDEVRRLLFPSSGNAEIARALTDVYELTIRESASNPGGRWWALPRSVQAFVREHAQPGT